MPKLMHSLNHTKAYICHEYYIPENIIIIIITFIWFEL